MSHLLGVRHLAGSLSPSLASPGEASDSLDKLGYLRQVRRQPSQINIIPNRKFRRCRSEVSGPQFGGDKTAVSGVSVLGQMSWQHPSFATVWKDKEQTESDDNVLWLPCRSIWGHNKVRTADRPWKFPRILQNKYIFYFYKKLWANNWTFVKTFWKHYPNLCPWLAWVAEQEACEMWPRRSTCKPSNKQTDLRPEPAQPLGL